MITAEVVNLGAFNTAMAERYPNAVKRGTSEGVKDIGDALADRVRQSVPVKSGKLRDAVFSRKVNTFTAAVGYNRKEAPHSIFFDVGAKPHPIFAKGRRGSKETKRISRYWRKHPTGSTYDGKGKPVPLTRDWGATPMAGAWSGFTAGGRGGKFARALAVKGKFFAYVHHPGTKATHTLQTRLDGMSGQTVPMMDAAISREIQKERG